MRKALIYVLIAILVVATGFAGCGTKEAKDSGDILKKSWEQILADARGTTVNFYGWGGDQRINKWLDEVVAPHLKDKYGIKLNRVGMDIDEILNKLLGEKQAGREKGSIDVVWINGENFYTARKNGLLFGPFTSILPNFQKYVNPNDPEVKNDFGYPIEGYEAPYGRAQLVFIYDGARLQESEVPKDHRALLELAKKYPGRITYPAPPDFTGSAFVRNIICDIIGREKLDALDPSNKKEVEEAIWPAIEYLRELKPYLWKKGESYPATLAQLHNMFADGEILISMDYAPYAAAGKIKTGEFPATVKSFVFQKGTLGNTHYLAIPFNAPNKAGALVFINYILSPEVQASKNDPANWGDLPAIDFNRLSKEERKLFEEIKLEEAALPGDYLAAHRLPEPNASLIPVIEEIWVEKVLKEGK
ncbi:MAG: ABC transporter substrate-binding protein [Thermosediminibacteraceae bacterium]|nr:ABC transporter substrate-binding protein [Thermosediminibacteraceae bacterium]